MLIGGKPFRVGFLVAGTQKGGTTSLDAALRKHPEICMAGQKEVHFFDDEEVFSAGRPDPETVYHSHFSPGEQHRIAGESTPIYMYWRPAPERIQAYNRNMKFILLLRNPIQRAYSHWNMEHRRNADHRPFMQAVQEEIRDRQSGTARQHRVFSYCDRGYYSEQLKRLWSFFPRQQTLVLKSEHVWTDQADVYGMICEFLGVRQAGWAETEKLHALPYAQRMSRDEKAVLRSLFAGEIQELERLLGWDCSDWVAG